MKKRGKEGHKHIDKFHELLADCRLYGSVSDFKKALRRYKSELSNKDLSDNERIKMNLALIWIQIVRGSLESKSSQPVFEEIPCILDGKDKLLEYEYAVVRASYALLVENDCLRAKRILEYLASVLKRSSYDFLYSLTSRALCNVYVMTGNYEAAEEYAQDSMSIFRRLGNKLLLALSLNSYAVMKKMSCQYEEAEKLLKQAIKNFREMDAEDGEFFSLNNLAVVKMKSGDWNSAEHYYGRLKNLEEKLQIKSENLLIYRVNVAHLHLLRRNFDQAEASLQELAGDFQDSTAFKQQALANEFLGELCTERGDYQKAAVHLEKALNIASKIAPESDIMTEVKRRRAELLLDVGNVQQAKIEAFSCLKLCRKLGDKHEMGAVLRTLAAVYASQGQNKKAASTFEAGINILKSIHECYELMRSCLTYGEFMLGDRVGHADVYLLEAKYLCSELKIDYYTCRVSMALGKQAMAMGNFSEAEAYVRKAEKLVETLQKSDRKETKSEIRKFHRELERTVIKQSMGSAEKLKILGKIYEEARFPIVELGPELAARVARQVGAESLFLVKKRNGGYRIPLKYNISEEKAKRLVKRLDNGNGKQLFASPSPGIYDIDCERKMVSVSTGNKDSCVLCSLVRNIKSFSPKELEFLIASFDAMERLAEEKLNASPSVSNELFLNIKATHPGGSFDRIVTIDPAMIKLIRLAKRASETDVSVLLEGETGVGKELFARAMHESSPRRDEALIIINTGGIPANFLESELFGYVKGAFTDARINKVGLVEEAWGGTLFLDEVGEMSEATQVKVLRLIENGEYRRLGENKLRHTNVRIISATNKSLQNLVEQGKFREDLFYRLSTVRFSIPGLRHRQEDIELLVSHLLKLCMNELHKNDRVLEIDAKTMEAFELYNWPGNVRELQNEIMRLVSLIGNDNVIRFGMLSEGIRKYFDNQSDAGLLEKNVERFERRLILKALEENDWNRLKTAEQIGIARTTLMAKMRKLNITS